MEAEQCVIHNSNAKNLELINIIWCQSMGQGLESVSITIFVPKSPSNANSKYQLDRDAAIVTFIY